MKLSLIFCPVSDFFSVLDIFIVLYYNERRTEISTSPVSLENTAFYYYKFTTKFSVEALEVSFFVLYSKSYHKVTKNSAERSKR